MLDGSRARDLLLALAALVAVGAGCGGDASPGDRGSPRLLQAYWRGSSGRTLIWSASGAPTLTTGLSPYPLELDLVFDRRLAGDRIEDTVVVDGVTTTHPKTTNPPVTVSWATMEDAVAAHGFQFAVAYNSLPLDGLPLGSTYVFGRADPGYPSGAALTFHLDRTALTNAYGEVMTGPETLSLTLAPFSVRIRTPAVPDGGVALVATDFQFPVAFSNQPGDTAAIAPFVSMTVDGQAVAFRLVADGRDPTSVYIAPPTVGQRWPGGVTFELKILAGLPDLFGVPLASGAEATFMTSGTPADGGADAEADEAAVDGAVDAGGVEDAWDDTAVTFDGGVDADIQDVAAEL